MTTPVSLTPYRRAVLERATRGPIKQGRRRIATLTLACGTLRAQGYIEWVGDEGYRATAAGRKALEV